MNQLTDKAAIKIALFLAIDTEMAMIDSYRDHDGKIIEGEMGVQLARRNVAAFQRVLDRYYGGARRKLPTGEPVSIHELMKAPASTFDPNKT